MKYFQIRVQPEDDAKTFYQYRENCWQDHPYEDMVAFHFSLPVILGLFYGLIEKLQPKI